MSIGWQLLDAVVVLVVLALFAHWVLIVPARARQERLRHLEVLRTCRQPWEEWFRR